MFVACQKIDKDIDDKNLEWLPEISLLNIYKDNNTSKMILFNMLLIYNS